MSTKRILIIVENLPLPFDRRVWQEATTLRNAGHQVVIICPKGKGHLLGYEELEGIHIYRHPALPEGDNARGYAIEYTLALFWEFIFTWRVFFKHGFDVIQACNPPDLIVLIALVFKLFGKQFVFDHHDINPELYHVKFKRKDFAYKALLFFERLTFRSAKAVISTNESYKKIAQERGGKAPHEVFVVRSGPDSSKIVLNSVQKPTDSATVTVGYVGIMGDQDGIDGLLRVADELVNRRGHSHLQFKLIGEGTELAALQRQAVELGLEKAVEFTGYLRGQALIDALSGIDIGVAPDAKNEYNDKCTMNKVMEYMALGKPVVQYDLTEGRFSAQGASLYAVPGDEKDFADKIVQLAEDRALRNKLGEEGLRRIHNELDWRFEAPKLLQAYAFVFNESSSNR